MQKPFKVVIMDLYSHEGAKSFQADVEKRVKKAVCMRQ